MKQVSQTKKKSSAEVKVLAVNNLYEWAEAFYIYEKKHFSKFIGLDIFKVDGSIKQKYDHDKIHHESTLPDGTHINVHYWLTYGYESFNINVKICINGGSYDVKPATAFCQYEELRLTLFNTKENKLVEADIDQSYLQERFDVDSLQKIADDIKDAAKKYEAVVRKMPHRFNGVFNIERLTS